VTNYGYVNNTARLLSEPFYFTALRRLVAHPIKANQRRSHTAWNNRGQTTVYCFTNGVSIPRRFLGMSVPGR
jgi:hypothetical protein